MGVKKPSTCHCGYRPTNDDCGATNDDGLSLLEDQRTKRVYCDSHGKISRRPISNLRNGGWRKSIIPFARLNNYQHTLRSTNVAYGKLLGYSQNEETKVICLPSLIPRNSSQGKPINPARLLNVMAKSRQAA